VSNEAELLPGTLDLLILKAVSLGPLHGYAVLLRIGQITRQALLIEQGALYPALLPRSRRLMKLSDIRSGTNASPPSFSLHLQSGAWSWQLSGSTGLSRLLFHKGNRSWRYGLRSVRAGPMPSHLY
jgi:hypothetical protein